MAETAAPRTFADSTGRVWVVEIHPANMKRVRTTANVHLGTVLNEEMKGLRELFADAILFADVLYLLCKDECDRLKVTDEDFGRALGQGALERAAEAFWSAVVDFSRSQVQGPLLALAEKERELETRLAAAATAKIAALDVDAMVRALTSSASAGSSPASSGSTPPG